MWSTGLHTDKSCLRMSRRNVDWLEIVFSFLNINAVAGYPTAESWVTFNPILHPHKLGLTSAPLGLHLIGLRAPILTGISQSDEICRMPFRRPYRYVTSPYTIVDQICRRATDSYSTEADRMDDGSNPDSEIQHPASTSTLTSIATYWYCHNDRSSPTAFALSTRQISC